MELYLNSLLYSKLRLRFRIIESIFHRVRNNLRIFIIRDEIHNIKIRLLGEGNVVMATQKHLLVRLQSYQSRVLASNVNQGEVWSVVVNLELRVCYELVFWIELYICIRPFPKDERSFRGFEGINLGNNLILLVDALYFCLHVHTSYHQFLLTCQVRCLGFLLSSSTLFFYA